MLNKNLAILLYSGIMTDTGSFRYENTSAHSHAVVEKLMAFKFSAAHMYDCLYVGIPVEDIKLFSEVIHKAKMLDGNRVYCVSLSKLSAARFSKSFDLKEKIFTFFPTFDIYGSDASTKLARANMNFWGTTFTIYDPRTDQEMATMHRSFLRFKNDWSISITNRLLFNQANIDPRLMMTVIAFQGDRETWKKMEEDRDRDRKKNLKSAANLSDQASDVTPYQLNLFLEKIAATSRQEGLDSVKEPSPSSLEPIAKELENNYKSRQVKDDSMETSQEQISHFTDYCLNLVQSDDIPDTKKKAILSLLKMRLESEAK